MLPMSISGRNNSDHASIYRIVQVGVKMPLQQILDDHGFQDFLIVGRSKNNGDATWNRGYIGLSMLPALELRVLR
jgi:hypothetical protein